MENVKIVIESFIECSETLYLNVLGTKFYESEELLTDHTSLQNSKEVFLKRLEKKLDKSTNVFEKFIISYSFVTGNYFSNPNIGQYKGNSGKRFNDFVDIVIDSAIKLSSLLLENNVQYSLNQQILEALLETPIKNTQKIGEINDKFLDWIELVEIEDAMEDEIFISKYSFLVFLLKHLLESKKFKNKEKLQTKIDNLIKLVSFQKQIKEKKPLSLESKNEFIFSEAYYLKIRYIQKKVNISEEKNVALELAETYEWLGNERSSIQSDINQRISILHYRKAVEIYNKYGLKDSLSSAKRKLDELKAKDFEEHSQPIRRAGIGQSEELTRLMDNFKCLNIIQRIIYICTQTTIFTKDMIKQNRIKDQEINPFYDRFSHSILNRSGQTIYTNGTEEEKESLALYNSIGVFIQVISPFIQEMFSENITKKEGVDFGDLLNTLPSELEERKYLFQRSFDLFLIGDYICALHLLVPQVENWFRQEAYRKGGQTSNIDKDVSKESAKTLTPIFELEELMNFLGEEYHWIFNQIMVKEPMNLRNKIAHGIELNDNGFGLYFILLVLKLLIVKSEENESETH
ncbi:DUF4209 domain-containing protein [Lactococcus lactis]|uniref:DUF4209 domain-containing protein n=1 Tax=Lactococcus lactis TaxID=1358 RepID=UPI0025A23C40|nr:DUF4209 domain-containing protein [Lactococcus lactis]MDM7536395.1 DUF4209 domain-containing protein [Lactococcus lactis]